jgi:hypothetical protein
MKRWKLGCNEFAPRTDCLIVGTTAAILGGAAIAGGASIAGSKKAAKATKKSADASIAESQRQFDLTRADTAPARELGVDAISKLRSTFINGDISGFKADPGYQFTLDQGQKAIDNSLVARGRGLSGAAVKAGIDYTTGKANQQFGDYFSRLATLAGIGTTGVNTSANAGANTASTVANVNMNSATQRGSSYLTGAAGLNNALQSGISNLLLKRYLTPGING